jgi:Mn2+/Fe2+ NRAMP family transporter
VVAVTLLPAILTFLILMLNNHELMGKYKNTLWQNIVNITIVVVIIVLSTTYGISVMFPGLFGGATPGMPQ